MAISLQRRETQTKNADGLTVRRQEARGAEESEACKSRVSDCSYRNRRVALRALGLENLLACRHDKEVCANENIRSFQAQSDKTDSCKGLLAARSHALACRQIREENEPFLTSPIALKFSGMETTAHVDDAGRRTAVEAALRSRLLRRTFSNMQIYSRKLCKFPPRSRQPAVTW